MKELFLQPIHYPFRELVNAGMFQWIIDNRVKEKVISPNQVTPEVFKQSEEKMAFLLQEVKQHVKGSGDLTKITQDVLSKLGALLSLPSFENLYPLPGSQEYQEAIHYLLNGSRNRPALSEGDTYVWGALLSWLYIHKLGEVLFDADQLDANEKIPDPAEIS